VLGKGASVLKIQAFLLRMKLSSALYCLEQLAESQEFKRVPPSILLILMKVIDLMDESVWFDWSMLLVSFG
jgi:hypothetical protein